MRQKYQTLISVISAATRNAQLKISLTISVLNFGMLVNSSYDHYYEIRKPRKINAAKFYQTTVTESNHSRWEF